MLADGSDAHLWRPVNDLEGLETQIQMPLPCRRSGAGRPTPERGHRTFLNF